MTTKYELAAAPLREVPSDSSLNNYQKINVLVQDSQQKCGAFVTSMFGATAGTDVLLDFMSTATSGVAAIVAAPAGPALSTASTIFGATKTSISANYLNTLSISHITQAIQQTYTADMKGYVNSLANLNPNQQLALDPYMERSKIQSYHEECALPAAEGSINSALQSSPTPSGQALTFVYTVTGLNDTTAITLVPVLTTNLNDPTSSFAQAGITALPSGTAFSLSAKNPFTLQVVSSDTKFAAKVTQGTATTSVQVSVTISGSLKKGDTVTLTATPTTPQPASSGLTAPAQASGLPPSRHTQ